MDEPWIWNVMLEIEVLRFYLDSGLLLAAGYPALRSCRGLTVVLW
jgi:hypothetical protein